MQERSIDFWNEKVKDIKTLVIGLLWAPSLMQSWCWNVLASFSRFTIIWQWWMVLERYAWSVLILVCRVYVLVIGSLWTPCFIMLDVFYVDVDVVMLDQVWICWNILPGVKRLNIIWQWWWCSNNKHDQWSLGFANTDVDTMLVLSWQWSLRLWKSAIRAQFFTTISH